MINTGPIRAEARACPGDFVEISKAQLDELLTEVEDGQFARRALKRLGAVTPSDAGIAGVFLAVAPIAPAENRHLS